MFFFVASIYNAGIKNLHIRIKETDLTVTPADEVPNFILFFWNLRETVRSFVVCLSTHII